MDYLDARLFIAIAASLVLIGYSNYGKRGKFYRFYPYKHSAPKQKRNHWIGVLVVYPIFILLEILIGYWIFPKALEFCKIIF